MPPTSVLQFPGWKWGASLTDGERTVVAVAVRSRRDLQGEAKLAFVARLECWSVVCRWSLLGVGGVTGLLDMGQPGCSSFSFFLLLFVPLSSLQACGEGEAKGLRWRRPFRCCYG